MNNQALKQIARLPSASDEYQASLTISPYDHRIYLGTQSHDLETPANKGETHKGGSIFCYDTSGNCIWASEHNDKEIESFTLIIPLKCGTVIAVAKMVKQFELGIMPKFYGKLFAIDSQGTVIQTHVMDHYHYTQISSGTETATHRFIVFGETKDESRGEATYRAWEFDATKLESPTTIQLNSKLNASYDLITKSEHAYFSAGVGIKEGARNDSPALRRISFMGKIEWEKFASTGASQEFVDSIAVDEEDNAYIGGTIKTGKKSSLFVIKLDRNGKDIWKKVIEIPQTGKVGLSIILKNNFCYAFSFKNGAPTNIECHRLSSDNGKLIGTNKIGPLNSHNSPLIQHHDSVLVVTGNSLNRENNMDTWIGSITLDQWV